MVVVMVVVLLVTVSDVDEAVADAMAVVAFLLGKQLLSCGWGSC